MALYSLIFFPEPRLNAQGFEYIENQIRVIKGDVDGFRSGFIPITRTTIAPVVEPLDIDSSPSSSLIFKLKKADNVAAEEQFSDAIISPIKPIEDLVIKVSALIGNTSATGSAIVPAFQDTAIVNLNKNVENLEPVFVGEISGTTLNVTSISQGEIGLNAPIIPFGNSLIAFGTVVVGFGTGRGGVGTYTINIAQTRGPATYRMANRPVNVHVAISSNNSKVFGDNTTTTRYLGGQTFGVPYYFYKNHPITVPIERLFTGIIQEPKFNLLDAQDLRSSATARASLSLLVPTFLASELFAPTRVTNARLSIINSEQVAGLTAEADDNLITGTDHGFDIGEPIIFVSLTGGVGLTENIVYWVIASGFTANTFRVSTTFGGSQVDITTDYTDMVAESRLREVLFSFRGSATATTVGQIQGGVLLSASSTSSISSSGSLSYSYAISSQITASATSDSYLRVVVPTLIQAEPTIVSIGSGNLLVQQRISGLPIYINLETREIVQSNLFLRPLTEIELHRNDIAAIDVRFIKAGVSTGLSFGSSGRVGIKKEFTEEYLAIDDSWQIIEKDGIEFYGFSLNMDTEEMDNAFTSDNLGFIVAKFEIEWIESGTINSTSPISVKIYNDVLR